jgi:hypothetical protein
MNLPNDEVFTEQDSASVEHLERCELGRSTSESARTTELNTGLNHNVQNPGQNSGEANRRLAMVCLAGLTLLFSMVSYFVQQISVQTPKGVVRPPQFITEIPHATNEEWMLLPGVGEKTASSWRKDFTSVGSLEELPGVGPIRAERLQSHVEIIVPHPTEKPPKKDSKNPMKNGSNEKATK